MKSWEDQIRDLVNSTEAVRQAAFEYISDSEYWSDTKSEAEHLIVIKDEQEYEYSDTVVRELVQEALEYGYKKAGCADMPKPIDMNDPFSSQFAEYIPWPDSFSEKAKETLRYFDAFSRYSTAILFRYKGKLIITDESLWLTDYGTGEPGSPIGGPRAELDTMDQVEEWLEDVHSDLEADGLDFESMTFAWEVR